MDVIQPLNQAVLFVIFNRLDTTKQVFETIRKAKPYRLYIAADGARDSRVGENEKVKAVRNYVTNNIDWECEVKTLFQEKNLGCKNAVDGAITWFFKNEEMGIILEDDCLPSQSFFGFCNHLLSKYKHDTRIAAIIGDNFSKKIFSHDSYFFSRYTHMWGWATWRRSWMSHKEIMQNFELIAPTVKTLSINHKYANYRIIHNAIRANSGEIDTWDLQWVLSNYLNNSLAIVPQNNLVKNIGYGSGATHTKVYIEAKIVNNYELNFPLKHPIIMLPNSEYDNYLFTHVFDWKSFFIKLVEFKKLPQRISNKLANYKKK